METHGLINWKNRHAVRIANTAGGYIDYEIEVKILKKFVKTKFDELDGYMLSSLSQHIEKESGCDCTVGYGGRVFVREDVNGDQIWRYTVGVKLL